MVAVALYLALFYQIRLYADALEQVYYLGASAWLVELVKVPQCESRCLGCVLQQPRAMAGAAR